MSATLSEFLLARIAEDEAAANGVCVGRWTSRVAYLDGDLYGHVSRQHPERVLAECEAKRRIVERAVAMTGITVADDWPLPFLAAAYASHPDYRSEWKP